MSDLEKEDYAARAGYSSSSKPAGPKKTHGATKKAEFVKVYLSHNPHDTRDANAVWKALSQADRDAYIGHS
jgi:hypothetical protein